MYLDSEKKKEIFGTYGKSNTDTGSPEALEGQQEGSYDSACTEDVGW